jgi:hypothetical protein
MIRIILAFLNVAGNFFSHAQLFKLCVFQANPPTVERVSLYLWGFTTQVIDKKVLFIIIISFFFFQFAAASIVLLRPSSLYRCVTLNLLSFHPYF